MRPKSAAYETGAVDFLFTPIHADVLRAKVTAFVELFLQSQKLRLALDSITALNAALSAGETRARTSEARARASEARARASEARARAGEARASAVLQSVADGIVTADENGVIESLNRSRLMFGYSDDEVVGQPLQLIVPPTHDHEFSESARPSGAAEPPKTRGLSRPSPSAPAKTARTSRWRWTSAGWRSTRER